MHTIIHIGAGQGEELQSYLDAGAQRIVLVEPNPKLADQLRETAQPHEQVTVVEAAVTSNPANNELKEYNLPEANSLHQPTGLKALFPGLKTLTTTQVSILTPEQLLKEHAPEEGKPVKLVVQTPGEEHAIVEALINTGQLKQCAELQMATNPEPYYESSVPASETLKLLEDYGYEITEENQQDPDWPSWQLARNPLKDQIEALEEQQTLMAREQKEAKAQLAMEEQARRAAETQAKQAQDQQRQLQQQVNQHEEKLADAQRRINDQKKRADELEDKLAKAQQATSDLEKSLEEHKTWFRNRKAQAEQLQSENASLKTELENLKQEKQQLLQNQSQGKETLSQLEQKMEQLFSQQATQLQQTANALGQHVTRSFQDQRQHIQNVSSLENYFETGTQPLEFGQWAIGADLATHLVRAIEQTNYDLIIEFGSGTSTVLLARAIQNQSRSGATQPQQGAIAYDAHEDTSARSTDYDLPQRILSFEQNKACQQKTKTALAKEGLNSLVDLVLAPVVPCAPTFSTNPNNQNPLFYDCSTKLARIAQLYEGRQARILVLVDGPASPEGNPQAREPALAALLQHLSAHQLDILLDDTKREGEQQVLKAWQHSCQQRGLSHQCQPLNTEKGATWLTVAP